MISLRVSCLVSQWICLEVNILCVIPILVGGGSRRSSLNAIKYFISQRIVSLLFINIVFFSGGLFTVELICLRILFKLGLPPFQSWLISILPEIKYHEIYVIFTIQKTIPLIILTYLGVRGLWLLILAFRVIGYIFFSLTSVRSIYMLMFLSSRRNGLWMISLISLKNQWVIFLFFYSLMLLSVVVCLNIISVKKINDRVNLGRRVLILAVQFFNLGGLPPFIGFLIKLIILKSIISLSFILISLLLGVSLMVLYIYVLIFYQVYTIRASNFMINNSLGRKGFVLLLIIFNLMSAVWMWLM